MNRDEQHEDLGLKQIRESITIETDYQTYGWVAVDSNTYDGPGSIIGSGRTKQEAINDLLEQLYDNAEDASDEEKAGKITGFRKTSEPCDDCIGGWCQMNCGPSI